MFDMFYDVAVFDLITEISENLGIQSFSNDVIKTVMKCPGSAALGTTTLCYMT